MDSPERKPRSFYVDYTRRPKNNRFNQRRGETNGARYRQVPEFNSGGNRGFIITAVDEVKCYFEMRNVLEQFFHELYDEVSGHPDATQNDKDISTEDQLEAELKHLRVSRPFKQVKTHCRNAIFLNIVNGFEYVDPIALLDKFFEDLDQKRSARTSYTCKVLPVLDTFRNNVASAKESITKILNQRYADEDKKRYFIEFQSRGNYKLETADKQRMIEGVADAVHEVKPEWEVNREHVDYIISLTALKDVCCLSILKDYFKRSKYNVIELCKKFNPELGDDVTDKQTEASSNNEVEKKD